MGSLCPTHGSYAAVPAKTIESGRMAFLSAGRGDWHNARSHAKSAHDPALYTLITHQYLLDANSGASFSEYVNFIESNPDWPDIKKLRVLAEMSLKASSVRDHDLIAWFEGGSPLTGVGKIALAEAYQRSKMGTQDKIIYLVRDAWRNGDFDLDQERRIQKDYGKWLRQEDHIGRTDRLLWEGKAAAAKRVLDRVPSDHQKLFQARIALIENSGTATTRVNNVPASLKKDAGLIYDRMQWRLRRDDSKGVREMLLMAPEYPPYPEKWWRAREYQIHKMINEGDYALAKKLLANHGQRDGAPLADAMWLKGWLLCEFLKQPKEAYHVFYDMFELVKYPVSKARAAYWTARAAEKAGDAKTAENWYNTATAYPTTFYGQLSSVKLNRVAPLHIPAPPVVSSEVRRSFEESSLVRAIRISIGLGQLEMASRFISHLIETSSGTGKATLAAELGKEYGYDHLSVRAAKKALQKNIVLLGSGYPAPKTPSNIGIERPLALAIARQESEYDPRARSPAGALGIMQLLSRTAQEVARKEKISFSKDRLYEPAYNMTLGSAYLRRLIDSYDGSYIMAIAAYNAGPGNVRIWSKQFGSPGHQLDNAVNWIERIPYSETRNYVQRVLENLQVYRHIEAGKQPPTLQLGRDLIR